jgi:hypothetical protein
VGGGGGRDDTGRVVEIARYAMLFFFVSRIEVSAAVEQDFRARESVSNGISRFITSSALERQM